MNMIEFAHVGPYGQHTALNFTSFGNGFNSDFFYGNTPQQIINSSSILLEKEDLPPYLSYNFLLTYSVDQQTENLQNKNIDQLIQSTNSEQHFLDSFETDDICNDILQNLPDIFDASSQDTLFPPLSKDNSQHTSQTAPNNFFQTSPNISPQTPADIPPQTPPNIPPQTPQDILDIPSSPDPLPQKDSQTFQDIEIIIDEILPSKEKKRKAKSLPAVKKVFFWFIFILNAHLT